ncbi:MAG TPA: undecaprenyl-diphosphate phosphatase [Patescibacteria group bacterium]
MNFLLAVFAGFVQGVTEFLPISSTGHLIIFEKIFGISQENFGLTFDASLHLGTLLAVLIFFAKDYFAGLTRKDGLIFKLIAGTVPAVVAGLLLEDLIDSAFRQIWIMSLTLIGFSLVFVLAEKYGKKINDMSKIGLFQAFIIGLFQAFALVPGVSRSGSTISAGLFLNLKREDSAKFAFILSGPIIAGAGAKKFFEAANNFNLLSSELNFFLIGMISSAFFGYLTIKYFLKYLTSKNLYPFVVYRVLLGLILIGTLIF